MQIEYAVQGILTQNLVAVDGHDDISRSLLSLIISAQTSFRGSAVGSHSPDQHAADASPSRNVVIEQADAQTRALIRRVTPNSAAAKAGLRGDDETQQTPGDVIVAIDGHEVLSQDGLYRVLDLHEVGDTLRLKVLRDQKTLEVSVTLQALPSSAP